MAKRMANHVVPKHADVPRACQPQKAFVAAYRLVKCRTSCITFHDIQVDECVLTLPNG
jgi:hypothetical protein